MDPIPPATTEPHKEDSRAERHPSRSSHTQGVREAEKTLSHTTRLIVTCAGFLLLFYAASSVVLPVLLAWVASMALYPPMTWMRAHRMPAPLSAAILLGILVAGLGWGLVNLAHPVSDWVRTAPESLPRLREKYQRVFRPFSRLIAAVQSTDGKLTEKNAEPSAAPIPSGAIAGTVFTWTGSVFTGSIETGVLLFLLLATGDRFTPRLVHVMQKEGSKKEAVEMTHEIQQNISKYLFAVSLINVGLGVCVGLTLRLAGMPNATMWGAMAAIVNYIPYFGPIAGIIVVAVAGLLSFDNFVRALLPAAIYLCWHVLEADLFTPFLLGYRFRLNPVVIFVALMFFAWLWGIVGGLLAMPILVTLKVICNRLPALQSVGDLLDA